MSKTQEILISERLLKILQEIENDSLVAKLLLTRDIPGEYTIDDPVNYISISGDDESKISYLTKERLTKIDSIEERWTSSKRFHIKPGGFVNKVFKNIPSKEVEKFATFYRSLIRPSNFKFSIVEGEDIKYWYHYNQYRKQTGSLGNSCMKNDHNQESLDFYIENDVKMLIMTDNQNCLIGRALLWQIDDVKVMDRIYTICDEDYLYLFKQWANKNGYLYKFEQKWNSTLDFESGGKKQSINFGIKLKNLTRRYPYMDTFKFLDKEKMMLYNFKPEDTKSIRICCSSDGDTQSPEYLVLDDIERTYIYSGDSVYLEYLNIRTHCNNVCYSEINSCNILVKDSEYQEDVRDNVFKGDYAHLNNMVEMEKRRQRYSRIESKSEKSSWKIVNSAISEISDLYFRINRPSFGNVEDNSEQAIEQSV